MPLSEVRPDAVNERSTTKFVQTPRWRIRYNEAGSGPPLILLHGSGPGATGWSNFAPNIGALSQSYRVIAMDFPGWGESDELDATIQPLLLAITEAVKLLMDALGIERAALVGNSLGGMAVQMFASLYADRVSHLVTMGAPAPEGPQPFFSAAGLSEGLKTLFEAYRDPTPEAFGKLVNVMVFDPSFASEDLIRERQENAVRNPKHLENFPRNVGAATQLPTSEVRDLGARLAGVTAPALIIHGRDDRVINVEHSLRATSILPNSTLVVFNRCGHWAQLEHARKFNQLVDGFISATS